MTKSKALKLLKQQLLKDNAVVINLYDTCKEQLVYEKNIVETKGKPHIHPDLKDFIIKSIRVSDLIENLEKIDVNIQDLVIDKEIIEETEYYIPEKRSELSFQIFVRDIDKLKEPLMIPMRVTESVNELDDFRRVPENKKILDNYKYSLKSLFSTYLGTSVNSLIRENPIFM